MTASLGSLTDSLNYKWDCPYADGFTSRFTTMIGYAGGSHFIKYTFRGAEYFGCKAFWDLNPEWHSHSCRRAKVGRHIDEASVPDGECGP